MGQTLSRSEAREVAYRIIFAMPHAAVQVGDAVWQLALDGKTATAPEQNFIIQLVQAAQNQQAQIDAQISEHLQKWTLDRLRQTDLAALRMALAEISLHTVPVPVIINEAVNLAKKYGDAQSGPFVNGILAQFAE